MKILHIVPSLHGGGAEKFCIDLANAQSNFNNVVICSLFDISSEMFMYKAIKSNVKVITLGKKVGLDIMTLIKVYKLIKEEQPDVVNTHLRGLIYTTLVAIFQKKVIFHTVHNMADKETSKIARLIYKFFFTFLDVTPISISKKVLESVQKEYGHKYSTMIENGVKYVEKSDDFFQVQEEITRLKKDKNSKILLTIGRISKQKNQLLLINVVNKLIEDGYNVILLIIGTDNSEDKNLLKFLEKQAKKNIYFLGAKDNVIDYLVNADAFCLSSIYEGLPITLLEALSSSTIPICTPAGGIVDVVSNEIGFVSKDFSEKEYYRILKQYLDKEEKSLNKLSDNGKKLFDAKYNIEVTERNYARIYKVKLSLHRKEKSYEI